MIELNTSKKINKLNFGVDKDTSLKKGDVIRAKVLSIENPNNAVIKIGKSLINVKAQVPLEKDMHLLLKVESVSKNKIIFKVVENIFESFSIDKYIKGFSNLQILNNLNLDDKNFIKDFRFSGSILKEKLKDIGVFFEKKLLNNENIENDLKFKLYKLLDNSSLKTDEKQAIKEILDVIKEQQILSTKFDMIFTFLPIIVPQLKVSNFLAKKFKNKEGKKGNLIVLNLDFEDIGKVLISILNVDRYLYISFFSNNNDFLKLLKEDINLLSKELGNFKINFSFKKDIPNIEKFFIDNNLVSLKV